jgi:anti-sigma B factor antagonist
MPEAELDGAPRERGPDLVVEVARELDAPAAQRLWEELRDAIATAQSVTLDMSYCRFLDSTGLTVVVRASRELRRRDRALIVFGLTGQPRQLFELTRVAENAGIRFRFPIVNRESLAAEGLEPV